MRLRSIFRRSFFSISGVRMTTSPSWPMKTLRASSPYPAFAC
jgi:hypothetical protein